MVMPHSRDLFKHPSGDVKQAAASQRKDRRERELGSGPPSDVFPVTLGPVLFLASPGPSCVG